MNSSVGTFQERFYGRNARELHQNPDPSIEICPEKNPILYDTLFRDIKALRAPNPLIASVNQKYWDYLKTLCDYYEDDELKQVQELFNLGNEFLQIIKYSSKNRLERLYDSYMLSFTLPNALQEQIIKVYQSAKNCNAPQYKYTNSDNARFINDMLQIIDQEKGFYDISSVRCGLAPEFIRIIRTFSRSDITEILASYIPRIELRFSEEVAANIIDIDYSRKDELLDLQNRAILQMLAGNKIQQEIIKKKIDLES